METTPKQTILHEHGFTLQLPFVIRQATREDLKNLEWHGQFRHYRHLFRRSYREQQQGNRALLVAVLNNYPIARLFMQYRGRNHSLANGKTRGYLYSFYVMEMFRGQGIGTHLLNAAESLFKQRHYKTVTIAVAKDNTRALMLYQRCGYQVFGEDPGKWEYRDHRGRLRQVHEPCWLLEKALSR